MTLVQINRKPPDIKTFALLNLGFRPFFLGASIFSMVSIAMWMLVYVFNFSLPTQPLSSMQWHAHEMIYGFSMAVISGFLLTAIMNWTGVQTIRNWKLLAVFLLWLIARILFLFGTRFVAVAAIFDIVYMLCLMYAVSQPIVAAKQWKQLGILSKLLLLMLCNIAFYCGVFGVLAYGVYWGIYGGLYLIISFILVIGSRVMPAFISNGVGYPVEITNSRLLSIGSLVLFLLFFINQLFVGNQTFLGYVSLGLFVVNSLRLFKWHTQGIWRKPLLWSLYLSFVFINLGFLLFALTAFIRLSPFLAIHSFAVGGIGLATLSMMSRVSLGHTGRRIGMPPPFTSYALLILTIGVFARVALPLLDQGHYATWIMLSQILWIAAFGLFFMIYSRMLMSPRVDGQEG